MSSLSSRAQKRRAKHSLLEPLPVVICSSLKQHVRKWDGKFGWFFSLLENLDGICNLLFSSYWILKCFNVQVFCPMCPKLLLSAVKFLLFVRLNSTFVRDWFASFLSIYVPSIELDFFFNSWIGWWFPHFVRIRVLFCSEKRRYRKVSFPKIIPQWCWPDSISPVREPLFPLSNSWNSESGIL